MKKNNAQIATQVGSIIDLWMPLRMEYAGMPGLAVAIASGDKIAYTKGFGYADKTKKLKVSPKTVFRIASISKSFTAVAIMQLVEKKKLRLEDPVSTYLPWFAAKNKNGKASDITIEDLLSHSSGIFRDGDTKHWNNGAFPEDLEHSFTNESLLLKRTSSFKYSNYGYAVLGKIIETVSGMTYEDYIQSHILKPLGMQSTYVDYNASISNHAAGFERSIPGRSGKTLPQYKTHAYAPATGFSSTVEDLSKFAMSFFDSSKTKILSDASKKKMVAKSWDTGAHMKYGLGLDMYEFGKHKVYGHSGGFLGFTLMMLFDPKEEMSVVVLVNSTASGAGVLARGILAMLYLGKKLLKPGKVPNYVPYTGIYRDHWRDTVCATLGSALIEFPANSDIPTHSNSILVPTKKRDTFIVKCTNLFMGPGETVAFIDLRKGKFQTLETYLGHSTRIS